MEPRQGESTIPADWLAFFDESGDHGLKRVDPSSPVFGLCCVVFRRADYDPVVHEANDLKLRYLDHEGIPFHAYDIRKRDRGFQCLKDTSTRAAFLTGLNDWMTNAKFHLFYVGIRKDLHVLRYGQSAENPYPLALRYLMERLEVLCEHEKITNLPIYAESRGKNEDRDLAQSFRQVLQHGSYYTLASQFAACGLSLVFAPKSSNIIGHQVADLAANHLTRYAIDGIETVPIQLLRPKLFRRFGRELGWKVFP